MKKAGRESETGERSGFVDDGGSGNPYAEGDVHDEIIEDDQRAEEDEIDDDQDFIVNDEIDDDGNVVEYGDSFLHFALTRSASMRN